MAQIKMNLIAKKVIRVQKNSPQPPMQPNLVEPLAFKSPTHQEGQIWILGRYLRFFYFFKTLYLKLLD